jgi:hypothetical protein
VEQVLAWLRAHEFADVDRVAIGSSVLAAANARCRVWVAAPTDDELQDLAEATPEGAWCVAVLKHDADGILAAPDGLGTQVAALVLEADATLRPGNSRGRDLVEWIGARQRAASFAQRALHVLADELPEVADALSHAGDDDEPDKPRSLPIRETVGTGIHETPATPMLAVQAAIEDPEPEPNAEDVEATEAERRRRIEEMRRQRELRKSVKHR